MPRHEGGICSLKNDAAAVKHRKVQKVGLKAFNAIHPDSPQLQKKRQLYKQHKEHKEKTSVLKAIEN